MKFIKEAFENDPWLSWCIALLVWVEVMLVVIKVKL